MTQPTPDILISIQPPYARRLLTGEKQVEYRQSCPTKFTPGRTRCWIYESRGTGWDNFTDERPKPRVGLGCQAIIGWFVLEKVEKEVSGWGWHAGLSCLYHRPENIHLSIFGYERPPQNWQYIIHSTPDDLDDRISQLRQRQRNARKFINGYLRIPQQSN